MNWTGGSLQRTKKANSGMLRQQKAYFAKARTNPQNTPRTPVAPFRPSYLRDDDTPGPGLSSFSSCAAPRSERSVTSRGEALQREHVPRCVPGNKWSAISGHGASPHGVSSRRVAPHFVQPETPLQAQQDLRGSKRKAPDADVEIQLLEANKKRLLTQRDWIGIDPLKPVSLQFLACKQNEKIGKRRITNGQSSVAKRQQVNGKFTPRDPDLQHQIFAKPFQGCAKHEKPENIRIRIGTDALVDTDSARVKGYAESEPSLDMMLFEQDVPLTEQSVGQAGFGPAVTSQRDVPVSGNEHDYPFAHVSATGGDAQQYEHDSGRRECVPDKDTNDTLLERQPQLTAMTTDEPEKCRFGFRLVDCAQDDDRSLRLVFSGSSSSSAGIRTRNLEHREETGETQLLGELESADASQGERVHRVTSDREGRGAYAIVDQEPWTAYFAISDDCARPWDASMHTRQSFQLDDTNMENKSGVDTSWSQHATEGQEDGGCFDTWLDSDSLPSVRRSVGRFATEPVAEMSPIRQGKSNWTHLQTLDEDEKKWQAFVLGSDKSRTMYVQDAST